MIIFNRAAINAYKHQIEELQAELNDIDQIIGSQSGTHSERLLIMKELLNKENLRQNSIDAIRAALIHTPY